MISGPSGVGKTVLCSRLLEAFADSMVFSISATSRAPRGNETEGQEYFFYSREQFEEAVREDRFAEWALVHDNYYGTPKSFIDHHLNEGRHILLNIDVQGARKIQVCYPDSVLLFIAPPSLGVLEERLRRRNSDSEDALQRRLANARRELAQAKEYTHTVINDDLECALAELTGIVAQRVSPGSVR